MGEKESSVLADTAFECFVFIHWLITCQSINCGLNFALSAVNQMYFYYVL